jgi:hypothetical protein
MNRELISELGRKTVSAEPTSSRSRRCGCPMRELAAASCEGEFVCG